MKKYEQRLGLNTISLAFTNLPEIAAAVAGAGFRVIEFHLDQIRRELDRGLTVEDVRGILAEHGLRVSGGFNDPLLGLADPDKLEENHAKNLANAELVASLGGRNMVVGSDYINWPSMQEDPGAAEKYAVALRKVCSRTAPIGVDILLEFNWGMVKTLANAVDLVRRSGAVNSGVLFDPAHLHCTPTKIEHLTSDTVPVIRHVHVNNMPFKPAEYTDCNADRVLPDDPHGIYDLPTIFNRLESHGYKGDYCIEMFSKELWRMPPKEASQRMFTAMKSVFDQLP